MCDNKIIYHPWKCEKCGKVYESLDQPAFGQGIPGKEPVYICSDCLPVTPAESELW